MTSRSDGLGPQKDPNSGRARVESGPAGTHRHQERLSHRSFPRAEAGDGSFPRAPIADAGDIDASTPGRRVDFVEPFKISRRTDVDVHVAGSLWYGVPA